MIYLTKDKFPNEKHGKKFNQSKPDHSMIEQGLLDELAFALMEGQEKYGRDNWKKGMPWEDCFAAASRHLFKAKDLEKYDKEAKYFKVRHLAQVIANCMFMLYYEDNFKDPEVRGPWSDSKVAKKRQKSKKGGY